VPQITARELLDV
jgi:hypothetical protein